MRRILATDCGSTTTKALLLERGSQGWRLRSRADAPTTVESPDEDVTVGVRNACREIAERTGLELLDSAGALRRPADDRGGVDLYLSSSSAGGGLQMVVAGVVDSLSSASAERAALGAGAIVLETLSRNDRRRAEDRVERIRRLRPDMILLAGGTEGGASRSVVDLAQCIAAAEPSPRLGDRFQLPVVYAGNSAARAEVGRVLEDKVRLHAVGNVRPRLEQEDLGPAREAIHELFMDHVMAQAPGYDALQALADRPIVPTPSAVGELLQKVAAERGVEVLCVDIGGATTDVFSVLGGEFHRTVSANLGMSYSASHVLAQAGADALRRWLPFLMDEAELHDRIGNKTLRPTTLPHTFEDLALEHALAREALRASFAQHVRSARSIPRAARRASMTEMFGSQGLDPRIDPSRIDWIVGSGGVLSHAPRRAQAALLLTDSFEPVGFTELAVDSVFMMPHLGVTAREDPAAALEVFRHDCLVELGGCFAPRLEGRTGRALGEARVEHEDGRREVLPLVAGELRLLGVPAGQVARLRVEPARRIDLGAGKGTALDATLRGGEVGWLLDLRGRPLRLPQEDGERIDTLRRWSREIRAIPEAPETMR